MECTPDASSEEELLQLRSEGKISDAEYGELLGTLRKTSQAASGSVAQVQSQPVRICGLAIASLALAVALGPIGLIPVVIFRISGLVIVSLILALALGPFGFIPSVVCGHIALRRIQRDSRLTGRGLALAGLIAGYTSLGLTIVLSLPIVLSIVAYRSAAVSPPAIETTELRWFPLDNTEGLMTQSGVAIDKQISSDGGGSLRIEAGAPTTVRLFETGDVDIENARLIYQAKVRSENVEGRVCLEMWCHFPGKGEFFSKGLMAPLTGTTDWTTAETSFFLKKGENPDNIRLNLVIDGKGTAWIDDIRLLKGTLQ